MTKLKLEEHEINSPLWQKLKKHYEERRDTLREANDKESPELQTANRRGRISEIKQFLAIGNPKQVVEED
jgi:hypothetical protein